MLCLRRLSNTTQTAIRCSNLAQRNLTTWSPLASVFNQQPKNKNLWRIKEETDSVGLFKNPELTDPTSFYTSQFEAIEEGDKLIAEAVSPNRTRPMVEVFDELSNTLCKVADLSEFIRLAHPNAAYRNAAESACIGINGLVEKLNTHRKLYDYLKASVENGTSGDKHVCELFLFDFEQCGIHLNSGPRARVVDINDRILQFGQRFSNVASNPKELPRDSLPPDLQENFGNDPIVSISGLHVECPVEKAREIAYRLYLEPMTIQEITLCSLLGLRHELADLCGFKTYADRAINASTMETAENVRIFLDKLSDNLRDRAGHDFEQMLLMKKSDSPSTDKLFGWDVPYYTLKAKRDWLKIASTEYSPYFSLGACMDGFNKLVKELYGITLEHEEMEPGESWYDDVHKLAVKDQSGLLGYIYCDFYSRRHKPHQDCHFTIQGGKLLPDGSYQTPIVVVMLSLASSTWNAPPLLPPEAVDNLFHELGHAIHSMVGRTRYQHVSGTRCPTDLAEVPSVLMEYFAGDPRVLKLFARHFQTQECMTDEMIQRLSASKHMFAASEMQLQVFYSVLDQKYHGSEFLKYSSTTDLLKDIQKEYYNVPYVENTAWQHRFSHLIGYGAKYYSYLISKAVAYSVFRKAFSADPLSRSGGDAFRHGVLKHGGSKAPREVLSDYLQPENLTPESLANALTDELDHRNEQILSFKSSAR